MTYDGQNNLTALTDPLNYQTTYSYSGTGQLLATQHPAIGSGLQSDFTTIQQQTVETSDYTPQDLPASTTDNAGTTWYAHDATGHVTSTTDPLNHAGTNTHDIMGRLLTATDANGHVTTDGYDRAGNPTTVTDPLGHVTTTAFDAMDRPVTVTDARGGVTIYAYDDAGRQTSIEDSVGNVTSYGYDADNRLRTTTDTFGNTTTLTRDADGEVVSKLDRDDRLTQYTHDPMGRVLTERWIDGSGGTLNTIATTYDAAGETTQIQNNAGTLSYSYDGAGNPTTVSTAGTPGLPAVTLSSTYGPDHYQTGLADNLSSPGSVAYAYDDSRRLTQIAGNFGGSATPQVAFTYDAANRLTGESRTLGGSGTAVASSFTYDAGNRLTALTHAVAGGSTLASYGYAYDAADRLTTETNAEGTTNDTYDDTNELIGATGSRAESYSYDLNGNRTMAGYTTGSNNQITAGAGFTYTHDAEQNLISKTETATGNVWTYTWDFRNRLTGVVENNSSGTTLVQGTYTYDALDRRIGVAETVGGTSSSLWTIYNGTNPYANFTASGTLLTRYLTGMATDSYLARITASGTVTWYFTDHEGTVRDLASTSGTVIDHLAYDSYGTVTSETSPSDGDRIKFDGMIWDNAIGDYYDNARYYDQASGRFVSQDPMGFLAGDSNLQRFALNDPIGSFDTSGNEAEEPDPSGGDSPLPMPPVPPKQLPEPVPPKDPDVIPTGGGGQAPPHHPPHHKEPEFTITIQLGPNNPGETGGNPEPTVSPIGPQPPEKRPTIPSRTGNPPPRLHNPRPNPIRAIGKILFGPRTPRR